MTGDRLEDLLYWNAPTGMPSNKLKIYCEFEVGGAHEDWGFVAEFDGKIIATGRNTYDLMDKVRKYFKSL